MITVWKVIMFFLFWSFTYSTKKSINVNDYGNAAVYFLWALMTIATTLYIGLR